MFQQTTRSLAQRSRTHRIGPFVGSHRVAEELLGPLILELHDFRLEAVDLDLDAGGAVTLFSVGGALVREEVPRGFEERERLEAEAPRRAFPASVCL